MIREVFTRIDLYGIADLKNLSDVTDGPYKNLLVDLRVNKSRMDVSVIRRSCQARKKCSPARGPSPL